MKRICITYHMKNDTEVAETCVTLPMKDVIANDLLEKGDNSTHVRPCYPIHKILKGLSTLQGYDYIEAVHFKEIQ